MAQETYRNVTITGTQLKRSWEPQKLFICTYNCLENTSLLWHSLLAEGITCNERKVNFSEEQQKFLVFTIFNLTLVKITTSQPT